MAKLKILFLTFCYAPKKFPRSVQISHLANYLQQTNEVHIITSPIDNNIDDSLLEFATQENVYIAENSSFTKFIKDIPGYRIKKNVLPDLEFLWHIDLYKQALKVVKHLEPQIIITFGQPMSTHLVGLKLKRKFPQIKWFAHFSDPWIDNIYNEYNFWTKYINTKFQDKVFNNADKLIFTSPETVGLVTKKYDNKIKDKSYSIPHAFDNSLFKKDVYKNNKVITIRYLGNFYGSRKPDSLLYALQSIVKKYNNICVEIIGGVKQDTIELINKLELTAYVFVKKPVSYTKSLELASTSDLLLVIDADTEHSPFLPSKLIDYIGANRKIFGITPPGASQRVLESINCPVSSPKDIPGITNKICDMLKSLQNTSQQLPDSVRASYEITSIGKSFEKLF